MSKNLIVPDAAMIDACVAAADITLPEGAREKLGAWLSQLVVWNKKVDLTAARSPAELADLMLADAFVLAARIPPDITVVDVGTGAGSPGLALALARPDLRMTLVEPLAKRAAFLRTVLAVMGREDIGVLRMKLEELETRFEVAISRATLPPAEWLARSADVVVDGGSTWVLLAREEPPEDPAAELVEDVTYPWPNTGVKRRAVRYRI